MQFRARHINRTAALVLVVASVAALLHADPMSTAMAAAQTGPVAIPVQGANRVATAIEASRQFGTAANVVLATGHDFPDALGGSALAGALEAPILLTGGTTLEAAVLTEIGRLGADTVYILGGTGVVSSGIEAALVAADLEVVRLSGENRYATAKAVADKTIELLGDDYSGGAFIATGLGYADALAAAPIMYAHGMPLVLVDGAGTYTLSTGMDVVDILGGTGVVPESVRTALGAKFGERLSGLSRYETAIAVATYGVDDFGMGWNNLGIVTGESFPDALCAGPLLGKDNSVLLMTQTAALTPATQTKLSAVKADVAQYYLFGGTGVIAPATRNAIALALAPDPDSEPVGAHDLPDVFCTGSGCHHSDLAMIHLNLAEGQTGCNYCHTTAGDPASDCESCHVGESAAHVDTHSAVRGDEACTQAGCHATGVVNIHAACTSCHNPSTDVTDATCATCHATVHAVVSAHTVVDTDGGCFDAYCHGTDVTVMHGTDFRLSGETPPGCAACHNETVIPSTTCLGVCHPISGFGAWHSSGSGHVVLESELSLNSRGCASCHGSDVGDLSVGAHSGCSCHASLRVPGAASCEDCHPDPLDWRAESPYHVGVHTAWESTASGITSSSCVNCHSRELIPIIPTLPFHIKEGHGGCVCHHYDTLFTDDYQPFGATTAEATECVSCHSGAFVPHL
jgi:putative cell wall-binding protein